MRAASALAVVLAVILLPAGRATAHGMRTAYVALSEGAGNDVIASVRTTVPDPGLTPRFPPECTVTSMDETPARHQRTFHLQCPGGLTGRRLEVDGLGPVSSEAVVRIERADGTVVSRVLGAASPGWIVPVSDSWRAVWPQYMRLGVRHIVEGTDHLLFLLALVLYVARWRLLLVTETAFTVSHSLSFSATALGLVHVSAAAAEACIALSLVLVALEVSEGRPSRVAAREGPAIALVFGLVHGLGFAGALSEVGLPDTAVASALVGFGCGVEVGQIAFVGMAMLALRFLARARPSLVPRVALAASYVIGITGSYWFFQRMWTCFA